MNICLYDLSSAINHPRLNEFIRAGVICLGASLRTSYFILRTYFCWVANFFINRLSKSKQFLISIVAVIIVSLFCFVISDLIGYRVVALILLLTVSLIAISFDILPVLVAAALSATIWDFFFIPPRFNFHVDTTEDTILLVMYFLIAMINAVLTYKIRQVEKISRKKEEKANAIKLYNTLLNSLSHEMRTPIATIIGATDNLLANTENLSTHHKQQLVKEISKASFRLNQQVENLLNMSRLESGFFQPKKDWIDINELVYDVVQKIEDNNVAQKISININPNLQLFRLDKMMLEQILYNLINNACIHTIPETTVYVTAISHGNLLQITIEDSGTGFPEDEIDHVFEKFYKLKNSNKNGTGLGLSIVKGFTEALGGSVHLQNRTHGGAKFTLQIPGETSYMKI